LPEKWVILSPVAAPPERSSAGSGPSAPRLGRSVRGVRVGLEVDYAWICYHTVIEQWEELLRADGAEPRTLWVERSRNEPRRDPTEVEAAVDDWSRLVDCGVVGLGN
jgi:hypothetical protein